VGITDLFRLFCIILDELLMIEVCIKGGKLEGAASRNQDFCNLSSLTV